MAFDVDKALSTYEQAKRYGIENRILNEASVSSLDSKIGYLQSVQEMFEYVNDDQRTPGIDKLPDNIEKFAFWPELSKYIMPDSPDEEIVESTSGNSPSRIWKWPSIFRIRWHGVVALSTGNTVLIQSTAF